jgi:hypothetical protein
LCAPSILIDLEMSVSVFVRIRPPTDNKSDLCVRVHSPQSISISDTTVYSSPIEAIYSCDQVIGADEKFSDVPPHLKSSVMYIGYGHSGSGKTHTMFGFGGVLNTVIEENDTNCSIQFFQVYNEKLYDLLDTLQSGRALTVQSDGSIPHVTTVGISSISELFSIVDIGLSNRRVAENAIHANSSRSHAILRIIGPSDQTITLVDLAGSERSHVSYKQQRSRQSELQSIHKSLHALRHCIMELGGSRKHHTLSMRRTSLLTKLLFSPNPKIDRCVLIACISPEKKFEKETLSTLDFVSSGLHLKSWYNRRPVVVQTCDEIDTLRQTIRDLQSELWAERQRRLELESRCDSPPPLTDVSYRRRRLTDETITPIILESTTLTPSLIESFSRKTIEPKQYLSQEWRHSQYDEILKKLWPATPTTRITSLIPLLPG